MTVGHLMVIEGELSDRGSLGRTLSKLQLMTIMTKLIRGDVQMELMGSPFILLNINVFAPM